MKNQVKNRSYLSGSFKKAMRPKQKEDALKHFEETATKIIKRKEIEDSYQSKTYYEKKYKKNIQ